MWIHLLLPLGPVLLVERVLVGAWMVPDLLYPQHHLFDQTRQILPENEVFRTPRVSSRTRLAPSCDRAATFNHRLYFSGT